MRYASADLRRFSLLQAVHEAWVCRDQRLRSRHFQRLSKPDLLWLVEQALGGDDENDGLSVDALARKFIEYLLRD